MGVQKSPVSGSISLAVILMTILLSSVTKKDDSHLTDPGYPLSSSPSPDSRIKVTPLDKPIPYVSMDSSTTSACQALLSQPLVPPCRLFLLLLAGRLYVCPFKSNLALEMRP